MERKKIVVIGGGFAGMQFVKNIDPNFFDVLLIDKVNYHQFQPLLYQVATSQLDMSSISFPFRKSFQTKNNLNIRLAEVLSINSDKNIVNTNNGEYFYDYLIVATGCTTSFYGNESIKKNSFTLKSAQEAVDIRNNVLCNLEKSLNCSKSEIKPLLTIVIAGGGPTGVELAGSFSEIKNFIIKKDFPEIDVKNVSIILLEGSDSILRAMSIKAQKYSKIYLEKMGVEVRVNTLVSNFNGEFITLSNGEKIQSKNFIWVAGIIANKIDGLENAEYVSGNRLKVDIFNKVINYDNVYALGDVANMKTSKYPNGHPQIANVAINQAKNLAKNLKSMVLNRKLKEYEYKDLGSMATVGRNKALVDVGFFNFKGFFAWVIWMFLHLMLILSVKNKLIIFINWASNYYYRDTSLRLIFGKMRYDK